MCGAPEHRLALASLALLVASLAAPQAHASAEPIPDAGLSHLAHVCVCGHPDLGGRLDEGPGAPIEEIETRDGDDATGSELRSALARPQQRDELLIEATEQRAAAGGLPAVPSRRCVKLAARGPPARA